MKKVKNIFLLIASLMVVIVTAQAKPMTNNSQHRLFVGLSTLSGQIVHGQLLFGYNLSQNDTIALAVSPYAKDKVSINKTDTTFNTTLYGLQYMHVFRSKINNHFGVTLSGYVGTGSGNTKVGGTTTLKEKNILNAFLGTGIRYDLNDQVSVGGTINAIDYHSNKLSDNTTTADVKTDDTSYFDSTEIYFTYNF